MDGIGVVHAADQTAVISTEHEFPSAAGDEGGGVYAVSFDLANMLAGDTTQLRVYVKVKSGGSWRQIAFESYTGAQDDSTEALSKGKHFGGKAFVAPYAFKASLKQTAGTGRLYSVLITKLSA